MATLTALQIISLALQKLGEYSSAETLPDSDAELSLFVLNNMLDMWSNESLMSFDEVEGSFVFVPGQAQYTIGPGGFINTIRPLRLLSQAGRAYVQDSTGNNYPMDVVTRTDWNLIGLRTTTSNVPDTIFYDNQYPLGILNIYPVPNAGGYTCFFDYFGQFTNLTSLFAQLPLPPGYNKALVDNLAVELFPYFAETGQPIDPATVQQAKDSKAQIKRTNLKNDTAVYDPELIARTTSTYNIYRDRGGNN